MTSSAKDTNAYLRTLKRAGYSVERTGRNHWAVHWAGEFVTDASCTPSRGNRVLDNLKAAVRRFERTRQSCP